MARLNVSIPDPLYGRLDRLRDRVNASKVCAIALEKELDMVEGRTVVMGVDESKVERLLDRLRQQQSETDSWYQRGRDDGETWVLELATASELEFLEQTWSWLEQVPVPDLEKADVQDGWEESLPESFKAGRAALSDDSLEHEPRLKAAYVRGWYRTAHQLWQVAKQRLS